MSASSRRLLGGALAVSVVLAGGVLVTRGTARAIDTTCLMQNPFSPVTQVLQGCSAPYVEYSVIYTCEECGVTTGGGVHRNYGSGECVGGFQCWPSLLYFDFQVDRVTSRVQNRRASGIFYCYNSSTSTRTSRCWCDSPSCEPGPVSPIVISLGNASLRLTGSDDGVQFDVTSDGLPDSVAWTRAASEDAFLALDRNENWLIDDGTELFGNFTPQPVENPDERNGFEALAVFDDSLSGGNEDGVIDENDGIFADLLLWIDSNHNGISELVELQSLSDAGVESIDLDYRSVERSDGHGNEFRYASKVETTQGTKTAWDVFFQVQ